VNVPAAWVQEIGAFVKGLAPQKLFVDGTYGVNRTHLSVEEVDIFSNHYYPVAVGKLQADLEMGKHSCPLFVLFGWDSFSFPQDFPWSRMES
jgi:hypothetical protein